MELHSKQKETLSSNQLYYLKNREQILLRAKENYAKNREKKIEYSCSYQKENNNKKKEWSKKYRDSEDGKQKRAIWISANKQRVRETLLKRQKAREISDVNYKLANRLRHRLYMAVKNECKVGSAVSDLGCSIEELKIWLENKFTVGMTWSNWGINGWHIDHIKPISSFNLSDREELKRACHYTNLQPLWALDNIRKNDSSL